MEWKKTYILVVLLFLALEFIDITQNKLVGIPSGDHRFHFTKFKLFKEKGVDNYAELGEVPFLVLVPPPLVPFVLLSRILPVEIAYFATWFLLIGIVYAFSKNFMPGKEKYVLLALLFLPSVKLYLHFGRILEFISHAAFITLLFYLDGDTNHVMTSLLFVIGITSHLPTAIFYAPLLVIKAFRRGFTSHIPVWALIGSLWLSLYLPQVVGTTGWLLSRTENIYVDILSMFESLELTWAPGAIALFAIFVFASLFFLGREGIYALPSFFMAISPAMFMLAGGVTLKFFPGINQILATTCIPLYSYLLLKKNEHIWKIVSIVLAFAFFIPLFEITDFEQDLRQLDVIDGNYTIALFPFRDHHIASIASNYLVNRGISTPLCSTWEYSDPKWYFYYPERCEDLRVGVKYIIFHKDEQWVKACGNYTETANMIIVKAL